MSNWGEKVHCTCTNNITIPFISRRLSSTPIRMPKRCYFQPGGVYRALHSISLKCIAPAHSALLFPKKIDNPLTKDSCLLYRMMDLYRSIFIRRGCIDSRMALRRPGLQEFFLVELHGPGLRVGRRRKHQPSKRRTS